MNRVSESKTLSFADGRLPRLSGTHFIDETYGYRHARMFHIHESDMEILYIYSGSGQYMVNGQFYQVGRGDIVICDAGILHGEDPSRGRNMRSYSIALTDFALKELPENRMISEDIVPVISSGMMADQFAQMMRQVYLLYTNHGHMKQACTHMAIAVFLITYDLLQSRDTNAPDLPKIEVGVMARYIKKYLDSHYKEPLTLQTLSEKLNISKYYLAHVFKQETGMSPMSYIKKRRIGEAQTLLMDTLLPVSEIAERVGFTDSLNFASAFNKEIGLAPSKYRQSFQEMTMAHRDDD